MLRASKPVNDVVFKPFKSGNCGWEMRTSRNSCSRLRKPGCYLPVIEAPVVRLVKYECLTLTVFVCRTVCER